MEYCVSEVAPNGGTLGQIALGGELGLALLAGLFGILAIGSSLLAQRSGAGSADIAGAVGAVFVFASLWFGYNDVTTIYGEA